MSDPTMISCPACGFQQVPEKKYYFDSSRKFGECWAICDHCGSFFINEEWNLDEDIETSTLASNRHETGLQLIEYKSKLYNAVIDRAARYAPPPKKIMDVGCSYGGVLLKAKKLGYTCTGVDIVQGALDYVSSQGIESILSYSCTTLDPAKKFDVITAIDMNMYWVDQPAEIQAISDRLNDGGFFIIKIIDKAWLIRIGLFLQKIAPSFGKKFIKRSINNHRFSMPASSFLKLLEEKNFKVVETSIKDAIFSHHSPLSVKLIFLFSRITRALTGKLITQGLLVVAQKKK